jgi:anti-anti-sigma factor
VLQGKETGSVRVEVRQTEGVAIAHLEGRFDAYGAHEVEQHLQTAVLAEAVSLVWDLSKVEYLSSAGLRALLAAYRKTTRAGGTLALAGLQPYCRRVLDFAGFAETFPVFDTTTEAVAFCRRAGSESAPQAETFRLECGRLTVTPAVTKAIGAIEVVGDVRDVLHARITPAHLCSKQFSQTEYSIGLGGLGDRLDDFFPLMGEMITVGGTMVWLPTDGHDTPDFLIPQKDTGQVTLRTAFNVVVAGGFNELMWFESAAADGTPIDVLYRALFDLAHQRRPDFRGVLGMAMRAQMGAVWGAGIKRSPIQEYAPANHEMVTHPSNVGEWFAFDAAPRHKGATALICGIGADLTRDLSTYEQEELNSVFYLNPAQARNTRELLHNHGVLFSPLPSPERPVSLEIAIKRVVDEGDFIDMRHLLDRSTIQEALFGVSYIQSFRRDPRASRGVAHPV